MHPRRNRTRYLLPTAPPAYTSTTTTTTTIMLSHQPHHPIVPTATTATVTTAAAAPPPRSSHHSSPATQQACAACKYQRRKCAPDCVLAPYFPHDRHRQFLNAHKLFGVSNITKIIKDLTPLEKDEAMKTIIFQSDARAHDPVGGCYGIVRDLQRQIELCQAELDLVLRQLDFCRQQEAAAATLGCYDIIGAVHLPAPTPPDPFIHQDNNHHHHQLGFHDINGHEHVIHQHHHNHREQDQHHAADLNGGFSDRAAWAMQDTATSMTVSGAMMASSTCSSSPNFPHPQEQMDNSVINKQTFVGDCIEDIKPLLDLDLPADGDVDNRHEQLRFVSEEIADKSGQSVLELDPYKIAKKDEELRVGEDDNRRHEEFLHNHDLKDAATMFTLTNCTT